MHILLSTLLLLSAYVSAHKEPKTPQEIEAQRALQAAAYHVRVFSMVRVGRVLIDVLQCAPAVAEFTLQRQRNFAQKVLAGRPSLPGYDDLFAEGTYLDDNESGGTNQKLLSCTPFKETKIQNNTCVLSEYPRSMLRTI